jgi:hypothetical protein
MQGVHGVLAVACRVRRIARQPGAAVCHDALIPTLSQGEREQRWK